MHYEYKLVELVHEDAAVESYINDVARQGWRIHTYQHFHEGHNFNIVKILFERAR